MNEWDRLEQKIDKQNDKMDQLIETMTTFVAFQARAEERHSTSNRRLDKLESKVEKLWDMVHKNSLVVNGAIGATCLIGGSVATWILGA